MDRKSKDLMISLDSEIITKYPLVREAHDRIIAMSIEVEKIQFQTEAEAQKVRESQKQDLVLLAVKYKMSVKELIEAAKNDEIDDTDDLFLIFNRSYLFSTNQ